MLGCLELPEMYIQVTTRLPRRSKNKIKVTNKQKKKKRERNHTLATIRRALRRSIRESSEAVGTRLHSTCMMGGT